MSNSYLTKFLSKGFVIVVSTFAFPRELINDSYSKRSKLGWIYMLTVLFYNYSLLLQLQSDLQISQLGEFHTNLKNLFNITKRL